MLDPWLKLVDRVLRPERTRLELCEQERARHLGALRLRDAERARALDACQALIESERAQVFTADDGVVGSRMTALEREWRRLARSDADGDLMTLWARIAPSAWLDRKRWRDGEPDAQLELAIALSADVAGVEAAEAALDALRAALAPWGVRLGARVRFRPFEQDFDGMHELLGRPLQTAREALGARDGGALALNGAHGLERAVHRAALARFPERPVLARALAQTAFFDAVWHAAALPRTASPATPLRALWGSGYVLSAVSDSLVTLELPPL